MSLGLSFTSDIVTFDQNWNQLYSTSAGGKDLLNDTQIRLIGTLEINTKCWESWVKTQSKTSSLFTCYSMVKICHPDGAFSELLKLQQKEKIKGYCEQLMDECFLLPLFQNESLCKTIHIQYCAKVTQAKCANFVLCLSELSKKVREKVQVTTQGLLSKVSLEQRTLFHRLFSRNNLSRFQALFH